MNEVLVNHCEHSLWGNVNLALSPLTGGHVTFLDRLRASKHLTHLRK